MPVTRRKTSQSPTAIRSSGRVPQADRQRDDEPAAKKRRPNPSSSPEPSPVAGKVEDTASPAHLHNGDKHATASDSVLYGQVQESNSSRPKTVKTGSRMKIESLSILDNLSTQILSTLSKTTYQDIQLLLSHPTDAGSDFATVRSLFDHTKRVYITHSPFLSPYELELMEPSQVETLRKANFATFFSSIFTGELRLQELDNHFLDIFVPENGRLLKAQASILLDLKTQAFMESARRDSGAGEDALTYIFPDGMEAKLLAKRSGAKTLVPSEHDFVKRSRSRRDILSANAKNDLLPNLHNRYKWEDFIREISLYLSKNFESMCPGLDRERLQAGRLVPATTIQGPQQGQMEGFFSIQSPPVALHKAEPVSAPKLPSPPPPAPLPAPSPVLVEPQQEDFVAKAARAAQMALAGHGQDYPYPSSYRTPPPPPPPPPVQQQYVPQPHQQTQPTFQHYQPSTSSSPKPTPQREMPFTEVPHASQTAPTQVLYERARQAATAKAPKPTRANTPSQRRPWTTEEENALMAGLDRVRGPHWSQILAMFGPGGTINESLKDRNQVQLKDKARNLKLFFLKSGIEVPYYLKNVTGDLRTRAPAQASKQEARDRERMQGLEDKAHFDGVQGIMALAGRAPQFSGSGDGDGGLDGIPDDSLPELAPEDEEEMAATSASL